MADDVQPITGTTAKVAARLCNFPTGHSEPLPTHVAWLEANVKPALTGVPAPWVDLWGYASHLGQAAKNQRLSWDRCEAVRKVVQGYSSTVTFPQEWGKGDSESGGDARNDDGYWRAVDVYVYSVKPPIRPRPPKRDPNKILKDLIRTVSDFLSDLAKHIPFGGKVLSKSGVKLPTTVRLLNADEQGEAMKVFAGSLDFTKLFVSDGLGAGGAKFTIALEVDTLGWVVVMNMGDLATWHTKPRSNTLIHELTHAWQSQHHSKRTAFMLNSVASQALAKFETERSKLLHLGWTADAYYYVPRSPFPTYAAEQIAQQVEDVYRHKTVAPVGIVSYIASLKPYEPSPPNEASLSVPRVERDSTPGCIT